MEWIPVSDKLPDFKGEVLGWDEQGCHIWSTPISRMVAKDHGLTHWMPLPSPPNKPVESDGANQRGCGSCHSFHKHGRQCDVCGTEPPRSSL